MPATAKKFLTTQFDGLTFEPLFRDPEGEVQGALNGIPFTARIAIPHYSERITYYYRDIASNGLTAACIAAEIPFDLPHFGLVLTFANAAEVAIHDGTMQLNESVRALVGRFGPVIFRNAYIESSVREMFHRNIFPNLRFHIDRGPAMPNQFSCFTRDPFDPEQRQPRASSTLFIVNIVAWLEMMRSGDCKLGEETGVRPSYDLFEGADMTSLLGEIILDQPWNEPEGTGEIAVIDNRTMLHATYHKNGMAEGYRIGARYLA